jgi:Trp operon repressor
MSKPKLPPDFLQVLSTLSNPKEIARILDDILTPTEVESVGERWAIVKKLVSGSTQREVRDALGVSVTTVSRGNRQLRYGTKGFDLAFDTLDSIGLKDPRNTKKAVK